MSVRATLCVCVAVLVTAGVARGDTERIRLTYAAADECPGAREFEDELRARTSKVVVGDAGRHFVVQIQGTEAGFEGRLTIIELDGRENARELVGVNCVDVASGLALVAALAIDPEASTVPRAELPPASAPEEPKLKTKPVEPKPVVTPPRRIPPERTPEPPEPSSLSWGVGLGFLAVRGPAPVVLLAAGPELFVTKSFGWTTSALRLGIFAAETGVVGPSDEQSTFRWLVARPGVCPLGLEGAILRAFGCVLADLGVVQAKGRDVDEPESATRFWAAVGPAGRVGLSAGRFYVDLELALLLSLTRDDFVFQNPRIVVHDVPALGQSAGIYLGFELW